MGVKLWYITGYLGDSDCDGPEDYNLTKYMWFDERFRQKSVEDLLTYYFSKVYRCVVIHAQECNGGKD